MQKILHWLLPNACLLCRDNVMPPRRVCNACMRDLPWRSELEQFTLFHYQPPIDNFISQLKFHGQLIYARFFSDCFLQQLKNFPSLLPEYLLPVPLHPKRLSERGFNQALEIAKPIAKQLKIPLATHFCQRNKYTKPQSDLSGSERIKNITDAFGIKKYSPAKHIAILDDVVTTGSTVNELIKLLKIQGVEKIEVWCVAKPHF